MDLYKSIEHKGFHINIYYDESPPDPRKELDNLGTLYTRHSRYQPEEKFDKYFEIDDVFSGSYDEFSKAFLQEYIVLPVYLFDHSGLAVSTVPFSCPWDSGFFGIIAVEIKKIKKVYNWEIITKKRREEIEKYLQSEIDCLDEYYRGEFYGFQICKAEEPEESLDSCWGYSGKDGLEQIESEGKSFIDRYTLRELLGKIKRGIQLRIPFLEFPEFAIDNVNHLQLTKI